MTGISFRLIAGMAAALALVATAWIVRDRFHQKSLADAAERCATAAGSDDESAPLDDCLAEVRAEIADARQSRICERTLLPELRPDERFSMAQACGAGVKRLVASGDAAAARSESLELQLHAARSDLNSAVERAERRTVRSTEREANGRKVIETAPRDVGGGILCDADCLRRLGQ